MANARMKRDENELMINENRVRFCRAALCDAYKLVACVNDDLRNAA